jgi:hypothetical protein
MSEDQAIVLANKYLEKMDVFDAICLGVASKVSELEYKNEVRMSLYENADFIVYYDFDHSRCIDSIPLAVSVNAIGKLCWFANFDFSTALDMSN